MNRPAEIELYANSATYGLAVVQVSCELVTMHTMDSSTRFSSRLEVNPATARALAAALLAAADLADKEAAK